jgi:hypothetical protein
LHRTIEHNDGPLWQSSFLIERRSR